MLDGGRNRRIEKVRLEFVPAAKKKGQEPNTAGLGKSWLLTSRPNLLSRLAVLPAPPRHRSVLERISLIRLSV